MGSVYLGKSRSGLLVAVKVVRSDLAADESFRRRFLREMDAMRRVGGGYVAELLDCDRQAPQPWLATRFVVGTTLADLVLPRGRDGRPLPPRPMPPGGVWWLAFGLVKALAAIHASGVVHRDLKPSNIMLSPYGPRVIDFGIATGLAGSGFGDSTITLPGVQIGTPQYMSPEQHMAWKTRAASDVYSLGAVLVVTVTGVEPEMDSLYRPGWTRALRAVPAEFRDLAHGCLEPRPGDRLSLDDLLTATVRGTERYARDLPSWWPAPTAGQVDDAAERVFDSLSPGAGHPTVTEHNGWEQWYIREHRADDRPPAARRPSRRTIRPGLDGEFYPAYRPAPHVGGPRERRPGQRPDAVELALLGDRHMGGRRYADAVDSYRASLRLDPKSAVVWNDLGRALCGPGRLREAERAFASALDISPGLVAPLRNRYLAIYQMGGAADTAQVEGERLEDACNDLLRCSPASAEEYANLADAYRTFGDDQLGASAYRAALDLDPDNPWLRRKLG